MCFAKYTLGPAKQLAKPVDVVKVKKKRVPFIKKRVDYLPPTRVERQTPSWKKLVLKALLVPTTRILFFELRKRLEGRIVTLPPIMDVGSIGSL